jgi:cytochrome c-type biogenesis protein CcmH
MRSRMVLGEADKAQAALRSGLAAFAGDAATTQRLKSAAAELGVPGV